MCCRGLVTRPGVTAAELGAMLPWYADFGQNNDGGPRFARFIEKNEQKIQIAEAEGRLQAAEMNKKAAIIEAEAVAKQIEVIGNNLQKHDLYLRWQWIKMMEDRDGSTIYVPTEANLPVLEAGKRS
jgi:selenocysteine lyase/cysteine desulfurase